MKVVHYWISKLYENDTKIQEKNLNLFYLWFNFFLQKLNKTNSRH